MIERLAIAGYRSVRDIVLQLDRLTIITGANGSGKSSLYRALRLLADIAQGRIVQSLAAEGGLGSTLWAGPEKFSQSMIEGAQPVQGLVRKEPISVRLGFSNADYGYAIDLGLPIPSAAAFPGDAEIKTEAAWLGLVPGRAGVLAERRGALLRLRGESGEWQVSALQMAPYDTMMLMGADPREALELLVLRERMREWRFHDQLRTDADAPARQTRIGTFTPVLASDGGDLAAALATIMAIGDSGALADTIADAFAGARVSIDMGADGRFDVAMHQPGLLRPMRAAELSEGTLRYLLLAAALLSPRPPELMVLNEPEASLHPDLLAPLARLIAAAARSTQIILISHAEALVADLLCTGDSRHIMLRKRLGETLVDDEAPAWVWPKR